MKHVLGKVLEKANTSEFYFATNRYFRTSYVEVRVGYLSDEANLIGEVVQKEAINPYFNRPSAINYVAEEDEAIKAQSIYLIKVRMLGLIHRGDLKDIEFPPTPGSNVFEADEADVRRALHLEEEGIDIGILAGSNELPFRISHNRLLKTHISILGQTGSGKSYLASKIAIELLKLRKSASVPSEIAIPLVFDSSGEYSGEHDLGEHAQLSELTKPINVSDHYFPLLNEKYLPLLYHICDMTNKEESDLNSWLNPGSEDRPTTEAGQDSRLVSVMTEGRRLISRFHQLKINSTRQLANSLEDLLKEHNLRSAEKIAMPYGAISNMRRLNLKIKKTDEFEGDEQFSRGAIVDLSGLNNYDERQIAMLLFLRQLYEAKRARRLNSRFVLFIDEAHNYVPSIYKSFCKDEILRLAREGRKYGVTLCLISQRPRWVDPTALSQCGNIFIFRMQNSDDRKHVFDSASLPDELRDTEVATFKRGEMIVTGDVVRHSVRCQVSNIDKDFILSERNRVATKHIGDLQTRWKQN